MAHLFDARLVPNVLADQSFQATGIYIGQDQALVFAVIDPRRHSIDVYPARVLSATATSLGSHFFTNGPQMAPPFGAGRFWQVLFIIFGGRWRPFGPVVSGGQVLHPGVGNNKSYFGRTGAGHFTDYVIAADPATGIEAIGGLVRIVANGGVVTDADNFTLGQAIGICAWGLRPVGPIATDGWLTETPYIEPDQANVLDGLIVVAGSNQSGYNPWLATAMLGVGVRDAVATDGSDSVIMGWGATLKIPCSFIKNAIQRWGFCCR